jgi:2-oxoglutarate ferredoxin oxidoreductase subunit alpha
MGDKIDVFIPLNQDTMDRHLRLLKAGACAIYDSEKVTPGEAADGVQLCPMPMKDLIKGNKLAINTAALGATLQLLGIESEPLETVVARQFKKKGDAVKCDDDGSGKCGYVYAIQQCKVSD